MALSEVEALRLQIRLMELENQVKLLQKDQEIALLKKEAELKALNVAKIREKRKARQLELKNKRLIRQAERREAKFKKQEEKHLNLIIALRAEKKKPKIKPPKIQSPSIYQIPQTTINSKGKTCYTLENPDGEISLHDNLDQIVDWLIRCARDRTKAGAGDEVMQMYIEGELLDTDNDPIDAVRVTEGTGNLYEDGQLRKEAKRDFTRMLRFFLDKYVKSQLHFSLIMLQLQFRK